MSVASARAAATSARAYEQIRDEGLLSKTRWVVYDWLYRFGPATAREVFKGTRLHTHHSARFNELEALGVVESLGVRECAVTGRDTKCWRVTMNLPDRAGLDAMKERQQRRADARPTRQELGAALAELRAMLRLSREAGRPDSAPLIKTGRWLVSMVRDDEAQ